LKCVRWSSRNGWRGGVVAWWRGGVVAWWRGGVVVSRVGGMGRFLFVASGLSWGWGARKWSEGIPVVPDYFGASRQQALTM
jgi:hypothetical protein